MSAPRARPKVITETTRILVTLQHRKRLRFVSLAGQSQLMLSGRQISRKTHFTPGAAMG